MKTARLSFPFELARFVREAKTRGVPDTLDSLLGEQKPDVLTINAGLRKAHYVFNPEWLKDILQAPETFQKPEKYSSLISLFGETGIFTSRYEEWKRQRENLKPVFLKKNTRGFDDPIRREAAKLVGKWSGHGETGDILADYRAFSLNVIFQTIFNADISGQYKKLNKSIDTLNAFLFESILNPLTHIFNRHLVKGPEVREAFRSLSGIMISLCAEQENSHDENNLVSKLLHQNGFYQAGSEKEKHAARMKTCEEMWQVIAAGYDSSASALTWTTIALARNPEMQEKLRAEISEQLGEDRPGTDNIGRLKEQYRFISEILRVYPSLHTSIPRKAARDTVIGDGFMVRKGEHILIPIVNIQRDPRWFRNPDTIDPGHMKEGNHPRGAYMPFLSGAHTCLGRQMFFQEAMIMTTTLLRALSPELQGPPPERVYHTSILPQNGCRLSFRTIGPPPPVESREAAPRRGGGGCPFRGR